MLCRILSGVVLLALAPGENAGAVDEDWQQKMFQAAEAGDWEALRAAIDRGADPQGRRILHWAAGEGHTRDLERLINEGASLEVKDDQGWTPLALAAFAGESESVRLLVAHGADTGTRDREQGTPLHLAMESGYKEVARILLDAGAELEAEDRQGRTPLFSAVTNYRNPELVQWLVAAGAEVSVTDANGQSPLDVARERLVEAETMADSEDPTPDWIAARVQGYAKIVQALQNR